MGRYAGNGMQPFQAFRPGTGRSGAAMQADLDRRHQRDAATLEAKKELAALKLLDRSLCDEIDELEVDGVLPRKILEVLKPKIDRARVLAAALAAERKRNAPK